MRQLYELDSPNYDIMDSLDSMCPALWRYRTRVSVEHLTVKFQEYVEGRTGSNRCEILGEFLKKVDGDNLTTLFAKEKYIGISF